jgi:hypothetical protein
VSIEATSSAALQISLIRLPRPLPRLELRRDAKHLVLTAHDADVRLDGAAWERVVPSTNEPGDTSSHSSAEAAALVRQWFGEPEVLAGQTRRSPPLELSGGVVIKISGTGPDGSHVACWTAVGVP